MTRFTLFDLMICFDDIYHEYSSDKHPAVTKINEWCLHLFRHIGLTMKITLTSIPVNNQKQALDFYTNKLGFVKKEDTPVGEYRWITVTSPEGALGVELLLEPLGFAPAKEYQAALYSAGIPVTSFESDDLLAEVNKLKERGVKFKGEPKEMDGILLVTFDDTCGNLICLTQKIN